MESFTRLLWYANLAATLVVLFRLYRYRLYRTYRFLFLYLLAIAAGNVALFPIPFRSNLYAQAYFAVQSLNLVLAVCVVLELYRLALAGQPALANFGRKSVLYLVGIAFAIAAAGIMLDATVRKGHYPIVQRFYTMERTMDFMVLIFLLLISGFMMWFPVKVKRNIVIYIAGFMIIFLSRSFGLLARNLLPQGATFAMDSVMLSISFVCLLFWVFCLLREGEEQTTITGHRWNPEATKHLAGQLDSINQALGRFSR